MKDWETRIRQKDNNAKRLAYLYQRRSIEDYWDNLRKKQAEYLESKKNDESNPTSDE